MSEMTNIKTDNLVIGYHYMDRKDIMWKIVSAATSDTNPQRYVARSLFYPSVGAHISKNEDGWLVEQIDSSDLAYSAKEFRPNYLIESTKGSE